MKKAEICMKALTRTDILNADDIKIERVDVPEWGGYLYATGLTGEERDDWENSLFEMKRAGKNTEFEMKRENIRARFVARTSVDESRTKMFTVADIKALGQKSAAALDRVFAVSQRLSGLTEEDVEILEKNLKDTPPDIS